jgi:hypothetical protein
MPLRIALGLTLVVALLPSRWLGWTNDLAWIVTLPIDPVSDGANAFLRWLRPTPRGAPAVPAEVRPWLDPVLEERDLWERRYRAAEQRILELTRELEQLQQVSLVAMEHPPRPLRARITGRSATSPWGPVGLTRGTEQGVRAGTDGTVAVYGGVHLVGRVVDATRFRCRLLPITNATTGYLRAVVLPPGDPDTPLSDAQAIQLEPVGDGTLVAEAARSPLLAEGHVVRLSDPAWPPSAQHRVIGTIASVAVRDEDLLWCTVVVRPTYHAHQLGAVTLLIESDEPAPETGAAAPGATP